MFYDPRKLTLRDIMLIYKLLTHGTNKINFKLFFDWIWYETSTFLTANKLYWGEVYTEYDKNSIKGEKTQSRPIYVLLSYNL